MKAHKFKNMTGKTLSKKSTRLPFPQQLFQLLNPVEENRWEHIISWVNDGTGFKVHDREKFEKVLLPRYFNTTRYASFTRQLCAYGFDCVRTGRQTGIYSHPKFRRNDPDASASIKREAGKATSKTAISQHITHQGNLMNLQLGSFGSGFGNGIRTRDGMIHFPSLLDAAPTQNDAPILANLFNTVRSQVADRAKKGIFGIPHHSNDTLHLPFSGTTNSGLWSLSASSMAPANLHPQVQLVSDLTKNDMPLRYNNNNNARGGHHFGTQDNNGLLWSSSPLETPGVSSDEEEESSSAPKTTNNNVFPYSFEPRTIQDMVMNPAQFKRV